MPKTAPLTITIPAAHTERAIAALCAGAGVSASPTNAADAIMAHVITTIRNVEASAAPPPPPVEPDTQTLEAAVLSPQAQQRMDRRAGRATDDTAVKA